MRGVQWQVTYMHSLETLQSRLLSSVFGGAARTGRASISCRPPGAGPESSRSVGVAVASLALAVSTVPKWCHLLILQRWDRHIPSTCIVVKDTFQGSSYEWQVFFLHSVQGCDADALVWLTLTSRVFNSSCRSSRLKTMPRQKTMKAAMTVCAIYGDKDITSAPGSVTVYPPLVLDPHNNHNISLVIRNQAKISASLPNSLQSVVSEWAKAQAQGKLVAFFLLEKYNSHHYHQAWPQ